jgi:hypothetical protein
MVARVAPSAGTGLVTALLGAGLIPRSTTAETLAAVEAVHPGFEAWAAGLRA